MTLLIVDSPSFLPLANEANVGDKVFVRSDQTVRTFLDVSTLKIPSTTSSTKQKRRFFTLTYCLTPPFLYNTIVFR